MSRWHNKGKPKRILSFLLSLIMAVSCLGSYFPLTASAGGDAAPVSGRYKMTVDEPTHTNWVDSFGPNMTDTSDVGRIWTDKTVWSGDVSLQPANLHIERSDPNHFLVGLSAISSNKSILGESAIPVDVVFVLDLSSSMDGDRFNSMVEAVNTAIGKLLEDERLHRDNRIGIVTYNSDTENFLPLDHYTTSDRYVQGNGRNQISLSGNLKNAAGQSVPYNSVRTAGATNIQMGIKAGAQMLENASDKDVDGVKRIPILVVMSDGVPTTARQNYVDVSGASVSSNFQSLSQPLAGFLTQLTGQYAKEQVTNTYGRDTLIYTLGLEVNDGGRAVLDPTGFSGKQGYNQTLTALWDAFSRAGNGEQYATYNRQPVRRVEGSLATNRYNDQYFESNAAGLGDAFDEIVEQIIIQSRYYPTENETVGGQQNFTGYLTFEDEIGQYMDIKKINGIVSGNQLITGAGFAHDILANGGATIGSSTGDNFVWSLQERLGLGDTEEDREKVRQLIRDAYDNKQIYYNNDTDYSNYIGWYGDQDGNFIGSAKSDLSDKPQNAVYFNRSYTYSGEAYGVQDRTDLMYVTVRIQTEIATGNQKLIYKIPSSLVPLVMLEAAIDGDQVSEAEEGTISRKSAYPIRLFYEVGLNEGVNEFNVKETVGADYPYKDATDSDLYHFYSNAWTDSARANTVVSFDPNEQNEFYYFSKNTEIFTDETCETPLKEEPRPGQSYYYLHNVFSVSDSAETGEKHPSVITHQAVEINEESLFGEDGNKKNFARDEDGNYYIPIGTPKTATGRYQLEKINPATGTAAYSISPTIAYTGEQQVRINVRLGNNGRLSLEQEEGISLEKQFDPQNPNPDPDQAFSFVVALSGTEIAASYPMTLFTKDGDRIDSSVNVSENKIMLRLQEGERAYITGLAPGVSYQVLEELPENSDYLLKEVRKNGAALQDKTADGVVAADQIDDIVFVNQYVETTLVTVRKAVSGNYLDPDRLFDFELLVDGVVYDSFRLKAGGEKSVRVPVGAKVEVREINAANYQTAITGTPAAGTADNARKTYTLDTIGDMNIEIVFTNTFDVPSLTIPFAFDASKSVLGREFQAADNYTFEILDSNGTAVSKGVLGETIDRHTKKIVFDPLHIAMPGTYSYTIREVIPMKDGIPGISYDASVYKLAVVIAENPAGGLTVVSQTLTRDGVPAEEVSFENRYTPDAINARLQVKKVIENPSGANVSYADFSFTAADGSGNTFSGNVGADGTVTFTVPVSQAGKYTYTIRENTGDKAAVEYDKTAITAVLTVGQRPDGTLFVESVTYTNNATFTNVVRGNPATVTVSGTKTLNGRNIKDGERFVFAAYPADKDGNINGNQEGNFTFEKNGDHTGKISWTHSFDRVGTYYYVLAEIAGDAAGICYDGTKYLVRVEVSHDLADLDMDASAVIIAKTNADGAFETVTGLTEVNFTNTYRAVPVSVTIPFHKVIEEEGTDRGWLVSDRFQIVLQKSLDDTFENLSYVGYDTLSKDKQAGNFTIDIPADGKYYYQIMESQNNPLAGFVYDSTKFNLVIEAETNQETGILEADYSLIGKLGTEIEFVNRYRAKSVSATIQAVKDFQNSTNYFGKQLTDFTFELRRGKFSETAHPDQNGKISFTTETFAVVGKYVYTLREIPADDGIDYDPTVYEIVVDVKDNGQGALTAAVDYGTKENLPVTFTNRLSVKESAAVAVEGRKFLDGRALKEGEFAFTMQPSNAAGEVSDKLDETSILTMHNDQEGKFTFSLTFDAIGRYYYVISEVNNALGGVTYDNTKYLVEINVVHRDGNLSRLTAQTKITELGGDRTKVEFCNQYLASPVSVSLDISKLLKGREWLEQDRFDFRLTDVENFLLFAFEGKEQIYQLTEGRTSCNIFEGTVFEPGTYSYLLEEVEPDDADENLAYDQHCYRIVIEVVDNGAGALEAKLSVYDDQDDSLVSQTDFTSEVKAELVFTNVYTAPVVPEEPKPDEPQEPEEPQKPTVPKTSAETAAGLGMALIAVSALLVAMTTKRKKRLSDR